ncbi:hypothetical protein [Absidia glauca]|uniref:Methyltransferase domain-containing protein n=1 Tax=Absidia glauca TaxID=4829 RepID=A0A163M3R3_ABSGL|nr:hypothetical protein [Absidia glauca]
MNRHSLPWGPTLWQICKFTFPCIRLTLTDPTHISNTDSNVPLEELTHSPSSEGYTRGSIEADFGRKRIGCVDLPKPLIQGINDLVEQQPDKRLVRTDALRLYESLRSTSRLPMEKEGSDRYANRRNKAKSKSIDTQQQQIQQQPQQQGVEPHILSYGPRESAAYTAGVLPSTYGAITNVLHEVKNRLSNFTPSSLLDFGTGPGTAIWAAQNVFDGLNRITGVDLSEDMLRTAEFLRDATHSSKDIEFKRYLAYDARQPKSDLVISAFTLGDISSLALQRSTIQQLWDQTGDILVLIERGTPVGFSNIARARQFVLDHDKEQAHVVAPCPHDKPCPLLYSLQANPEKFWCHFSQRVQRPSFLMKTKHSKHNTEDSKYSYVVLRKGPRPSTKPSPISVEEEGTSEITVEEQAYSWPRLIQPPLKKNKHVVMDICSSSGTIQRMVIPKSQGKVPYRDARKSAWGDAFPHGSKNKVVTRMNEGVVNPDQK